ncbi:hypothetical protein CWI37_0655p0040 [Hamiltosporidium tvaerminnensis]|uniref:Uncharacterized protein n=2 Tax=Hamiltosporidium TaxID=1176354 RepID=A0A4Q9LER8_9MICR|nr:hypothetical protein CWI37_0655p0040 [Hamiltosporidium tvaerminnensis]TBU06394.1 hypothetical protein CWI39_0503p0040 [Hamiltosporidium magnivora]
MKTCILGLSRKNLIFIGTMNVHCKIISILFSNEFQLNFKDINEDDTDIKICINTKAITYDDFLYFIRIIKDKYEVKEL